MKIVIYGLGRRFYNYYDELKEEKIVAVSDINSEIITSNNIKRPFVHIEKIRDLAFDYLVVTPKNAFMEIATEMIRLYGINPACIISLEYYLKIKKKKGYCRSIDIYDSIHKISKTIISADFFRNKIERVSYEALGHEINQEVLNIKGHHVFLDSLQIIKIFVVTHKETKKININSYKYIGVGEKSDELECDVCDNTKDNISNYNSLINECTALYWIWKNDNSDIVGLNHYRRVFESPVNEGWPLQCAEIEMILEGYDVIVAQHILSDKETVLATMRYDVDDRAYDRSFPLVREIYSKVYPEDIKSFDDMIYGNVIFPCEMFIMKRERLEEYCNWLFPLVFEMVKQITIDDEWDEHSKRIIGFWVERLLTVWLFITKYTIYELPILMLP